MKTILFARHAESIWDNPDWTDRSRPLSAQGLRDAESMAQILKKNAAQPDCVISSPANRTHTTAKFYAAIFNINETAIILEEKIYEAYSKTIWSVLQKLDDKYNTVILVGHNPAITHILHEVGTADYYADVPPCGVFQVRFAVENWQNAMPQTAFLAHFWSVNSI